MNSRLFKKINKYYKIYLDFFSSVNENRLDIYAACAAFYIFLSFIPILVLVIALVPYMPFSQVDLERMIMGFVPEGYTKHVEYLIDELYHNSKTALSVSTIAVLWASSKGILGITKGLNEIICVKEYRNQIVMRIRSVYYTIFLIIGIVFSLVFSVFGNGIVQIIEQYIFIPSFVYSILAFKNLAILILNIVLFLYFFVALPARKMKIKEQVLGAFLSAFIWWIFTRLFSFYLSLNNSYTIYGSFAVVIIIGVWLYVGMYIMFMGAQINQYIASKKGNRHEGKN